jgi:Hypothetical protein (DUF2513)
MKRDLDLIRTLLLEIEAHDDPTTTMTVRGDGHTEIEVQYHLKLLRDAGYIVAVDHSSGSTLDYRPKSVTWHGHEFLDAARNDGIWRQVKVKLKDMGMDAPLSVIEKLAIKYVAAHLGLGDL